MGLGTGLDDTKNLARTGFRFPDRPDRSESLYRQQTRGPLATTLRPSGFWGEVEKPLSYLIPWFPGTTCAALW